MRNVYTNMTVLISDALFTNLGLQIAGGAFKYALSCISVLYRVANQSVIHVLGSL